MKKLMNRAGLLASAFALALAVALALNAAGQTAEVAQAQTTGVAEVRIVRGSDTDGNGLIEITNADQLNAMRYDLNGNGIPDRDLLNTAYTDYLSCGQTNTSDTASCKGYELKSDISLDDLPASDKPWTAIGPWQSVFDGGGFSITGLDGNSGLFGTIGAGAVVKNVDVVKAVITRNDQRGHLGVLANVNEGTIIGSYVTGEITRSGTTASGDIGGLVARNQKSGKIYASVADVDIKVKDIPATHFIRVGGLVGVNVGAIHRSYAYGNVIDARSDEARNANSTRSNGFVARGFAVNNRGKIQSSISYGDKIVTLGDGGSIADSKSKYPARFGPVSETTCALLNEWEFTCPTPTPTPTN